MKFAILVRRLLANLAKSQSQARKLFQGLSPGHLI